MHLSGYLLASPKNAEISRAMLVLGKDQTKGGFSIQFSRFLFNSRQWEEYEYLTDDAVDEEDRNNQNGPPYSHTMVSVRSGSKILLLAERKKIADHILTRVLNQRIFPNLRKVRMHIAKLVESCQSSDSLYSISTLHGSFSGSDRHISRISVYGDDITESSLYREQRHLFNFYSCGVLRRMRENLLRANLGEDSEIMLLGNDGFVSSQLSNPERAREVILLINYIMRQRWVDEWVPNIGME